MENAASLTNPKKCRRCLLFAEAEADASMIEKYLARIKPCDLADERTAEMRLDVCRTCSYLLNATCNACGCYVEFRANFKNGNCPKHKWPR